MQFSRDFYINICVSSIVTYRNIWLKFVHFFVKHFDRNTLVCLCIFMDLISLHFNKEIYEKQGNQTVAIRLLTDPVTSNIYF